MDTTSLPPFSDCLPLSAFLSLSVCLKVWRVSRRPNKLFPLTSPLGVAGDARESESWVALLNFPAQRVPASRSLSVCGIGGCKTTHEHWHDPPQLASFVWHRQGSLMHGTTWETARQRRKKAWGKESWVGDRHSGVLVCVSVWSHYEAFPSCITTAFKTFTWRYLDFLRWVFSKFY